MSPCLHCFMHSPYTRTTLTWFILFAYPYWVSIACAWYYFVLLFYTLLPKSTWFLAKGTGWKRRLVGVTAFENSDLHGKNLSLKTWFEEPNHKIYLERFWCWDEKPKCQWLVTRFKRLSTDLSWSCWIDINYAEKLRAVKTSKRTLIIKKIKKRGINQYKIE